jgi:hypothetical protein
LAAIRAKRPVRIVLPGRLLATGRTLYLERQGLLPSYPARF